MRLRSLALLSSMVCLPAAQAAITFNLNFLDAAGESWTAARQGLLIQAATEWGSLFVNDYSIDVDVTFADSAGSYLGRWSGSYEPGMVFTGDDVTPWHTGVAHTITFATDYINGATNYLWFDPSPLTAEDQPGVAWDALSVARHEFGHLLGFTSSGFYADNIGLGSEIDHWGNQLSGGSPYVFDATGLNVELVGQSHLADSGVSANDLMVPSIANGVRREISTLDLQMLTTAYGYALIPEAGSLAVFLGSLASIGLALRRRPACSRRASPR